MKIKLSALFLAGLAGVMAALAGCGNETGSKTEPPPATPPEKGSLQTAVEGFTGKIAVDQGQRAKDQIKAVSEARKRDQEDIMR